MNYDTVLPDRIMNYDTVTYQIRRQEAVFFIDQLVDGELDKSYGPYWKLENAQAQIEAWNKS